MRNQARGCWTFRDAPVSAGMRSPVHAWRVPGELGSWQRLTAHVCCGLGQLDPSPSAVTAACHGAAVSICRSLAAASCARHCSGLATYARRSRVAPLLPAQPFLGPGGGNRQARETSQPATTAAVPADAPPPPWTFSAWMQAGLVHAPARHLAAVHARASTQTWIPGFSSASQPGLRGLLIALPRPVHGDAWTRWCTRAAVSGALVREVERPLVATRNITYRGSGLRLLQGPRT